MLKTQLLNSLIMQRKSIPGFLINSVTLFETSTGVKKKMSLKCSCAKYSFEFKKQLEQHVKLLADSHPEIHKQIESVLSEKINYYLQAFWQKCSAL